MQGRRSLYPDLVKPNPEIERLIYIKLENQMVGDPREPPKQMKEYFIPSTYNPSIFSSFYGIKYSNCNLEVDLNLIVQKLDKVDLLVQKFDQFLALC